MLRRRHGHRDATPGTPPADRARPDQRRILVLSASMGAGHDGAARELAHRLRSEGHAVEVRDFLEAGPIRMGAALKIGYRFELSHAPSMYDATYRFWQRVPGLCPLVAWLVAALTGRRVLRWVSEGGFDLVVSTYPLSTLCLGHLRSRARLAVPAVNFITDFGVHPLWVHRGIDLNLAVHETPAATARERSGRPTLACVPLVSGEYEAARDPALRAAARAQLGLLEGEVAVLIVAGSWGIGGIGDGFEAVTCAGRFVPVVVCGHDGRLHRRVASLASLSGAPAVVLGWTDQMPALMAACDALVENAGGLTSLEAMRAGLPVISYKPIAGHGRDNTAAMAAAGVGRMANTREQLVEALDAVTRPGLERTRQVRSGRAMFAGHDAAAAIVGAAGHGEATPPELAGRRPARRVLRATAMTAGIGALAWGGLTTGVGIAAAEGAGVAHSARHAGAVAYLAVRLNAQQAADPAIVADLKGLDATAVVDRQTALAAPGALRRLAAAGVDLENGGQGAWRDSHGEQRQPTLWTRARGDVRAAGELRSVVGEPVTVFVPGRRLNAFDLVDSRHAHATIVVPDVTWTASDTDDPSGHLHLTARHVYLVNGLHATPVELSLLLERIAASLTAQRLSAAPLTALR